MHMKNNNQPANGIIQQRVFEASIRAVSEDSRTMELSFSSELPYDRWFGPEILSHEEGAVDLSRLTEVGTVLFTHGKDPKFGRLPIAKIDKAWLDQEQRKGRALVTFDDDENSDLVFQKVKKGLIKGVSVGYAVSSWEEVAAGKTSVNGRFTGPAYIAIRWEPYEISIEPLPADPSVGVGRNVEDDVAAPAIGCLGSDDLLKAERQRVTDITAICREFNINPEGYINAGVTIDQIRSIINDNRMREYAPSCGSGISGIAVGVEEADKIRDAASDAILIRGGIRVEKPANGAKEFRGMKLRDIAIECLMRAGISNPHKMDNDELFRNALTPDSQFGSILSNSVNKSMAIAYKAANTTYQLWTSIGSNPDFKGAAHYQISEAGELTKMTQNGEFKFDEVQDNGVLKSIATFGKMFGITRQAMINDDIGILTKVPEAYVRAAKRGINKLVYQMIGNNPAIYDGQVLFHDDHKNLGTPGVISVTTAGEARRLMRRQTNIRGIEKLNIVPAYLITPATLETDAEKFINSTADPDSNNSGVINPFNTKLKQITDAELDDYSETAYYFAASSADVDTVEVTYLNGDDMPKLENRFGFDFLGIEWRIYIDYGVTVLDYRGLVKNAGR